MSTKKYLLIVLVVVIGILASFYSGFYAKNIFLPDKSEQTFKPTFIDEIILVSKSKPHQILVLSAFRTFKSKDLYNYVIKAFYFDGKLWSKEYTQGESQELYGIPENQIVPEWKINSDPSYMLKQSSNGKLNIENNSIVFDVPLLLSEMSVRNSPKYTKFMSETDGKLTINNVEFDCYVLYNRIYSFNPPESLVFTTDPAGIETEWLAFWDNEGNFYSIDETIVDNKKNSSTYKAHSMAIEKDNINRIQNSFSLDLTKDGINKYSVYLGEEIQKTLIINKSTAINKAINANDIWYIGLADGEVKTSENKTIKGFGIFEQISQ